MHVIDTIKGVVTYATAAVSILGSIVIAFVAWSAPIPADGGRDIAILFGFLGGIVGAASTFLFLGEARTQANHATERATAATAAAVSDVRNGGGHAFLGLTGGPCDRCGRAERDPTHVRG